MHLHTQALMDAYKYPYKHLTFLGMHIHAHMHMCMHARARTHTHTHTYTHKMNTYSRHTQTHINMHTYKSTTPNLASATTHLQHLVRAGLHTWHHVDWRESNLLHLCKVVLGVAVQNHAAHGDQGVFSVGPDLTGENNKRAEYMAIHL